MSLAQALGHHSAFTLESSRTVALSEAERAQGCLQATDAGVARYPFPTGLFAGCQRGRVRDQTSLYQSRQQPGGVVFSQQRHWLESGATDYDLPETGESGRTP